MEVILKWINFASEYLYNIYSKNYKFIKRGLWVFITIILIIIPIYISHLTKYYSEDKSRLKKYNQFIQTYIKVINNLDIKKFNA